MHSCNGPKFVFQLNFSLKLGCSTAKSPGSWTSQEANARLKCVFSLVMEKLNSKGCGVPEEYETFSCVTIYRLGHLLPDARWFEQEETMGDLEDALLSYDDEMEVREVCSGYKDANTT
ncbi:hypothetical protein Pint_25576 [Pistacia integerrima]|uniref:Uncharacterized protein n=1 Tax=Pistacia integerrima TaxID=434235 RepID=A0ACC0YFV4_9ROSI|nr:hypothetical protein Pint_25576 [Pistacia integerrima]